MLHTTEDQIMTHANRNRPPAGNENREPPRDLADPRNRRGCLLLITWLIAVVAGVIAILKLTGVI